MRYEEGLSGQHLAWFLSRLEGRKNINFHFYTTKAISAWIFNFSSSFATTLLVKGFNFGRFSSKILHSPSTLYSQKSISFDRDFLVFIDWTFLAPFYSSKGTYDVSREISRTLQIMIPLWAAKWCKVNDFNEIDQLVLPHVTECLLNFEREICFIDLN